MSRRAVRVLIASPDPVYARFLQESLSQRGMQVSVRVAAVEPNLAELDVLLVEALRPSDGHWALVERVRDQSPLLEIIAISSDPLVGGAVQALRRGIFALLAYPVSDEQLTGEIEAACARKRRAEQRMAELEACRPPGGQPRAHARRPKRAPR